MATGHSAAVNLGAQKIRQTLLTIVLAVAALYFGREILLPLAMAILLTFLLAPMVTWLEKHRFRRVPAVMLVMFVIFSVLSIGGWYVGRELEKLAQNLPTYTENLKEKIKNLKPTSGGIFDSIRTSVTAVEKELEEGVPEEERAQPVRVVSDESALAPLGSYVNTVLSPLATVAIITVLVIFMLIQREDLRNRLVRLAGKRLTLTTRTLDEVGSRISRYLLMLFIVNGTFGLAVAIGLAVIGVPYFGIWGLLAATLRFIPYVGPIMAGVFPVAMAVVHFPGHDWFSPLLTVGWIIVLELISNNIVEPLAYGRSTGVSVVALLVSATFWAWIWGPLGLMLSVPLTVVLAVLGEHVPAFETLGVMLSDKPPLPTHMTYYQRLLAGDSEEAAEILEEHHAAHCLIDDYDNVLIPALALAEGDRARGELSETDRKFIWDTTREFIQDLVTKPSAKADECKPADDSALGLRAYVVGCPAHDDADELALLMLGQVVNLRGGEFEIISEIMLVSEILSTFQKRTPDAVCISCLGPVGGAQTRYLCKRLRQSFPDLRIIVGRWGYKGDVERLTGSLKRRGADQVVTTLAEASDLLQRILPLAAKSGVGASPPQQPESEVQRAAV